MKNLTPYLYQALFLFIFLLLPLTAGQIGSWLSMDAVNNWYPALEKPPLTPPDWIFAPVWITLYILMGVAAFLIWRHSREQRKVKFALSVFMLHLAVNAGWSGIFFGLASPGWALIVIAVLIAMVIWLIKLFYQISPVAAYLLIPYLLWLGWASYLNVGIWLLN